MKPIRLLTVDLLALLGDLLHTAAIEPGMSGCYGILLHSARGYAGDEPGQTGLLVGTSTNGQAIGHTWIPAAGELPPTLWPAQDVRAVIASFKPLVKDNKEHVSEVRIEDGTVVIAEDPDLFGNGLAVSFGPASLDDFPRNTWQLVTEVRLTAPDNGPALARTDFGPKVLAPFIAVAKSRNTFVQTYRHHQRTPMLIQIGQTYRGALMPASWDEVAHDGVAPECDVYPADLPALPNVEADLVSAGDGGES